MRLLVSNQEVIKQPMELAELFGRVAKIRHKLAEIIRSSHSMHEMLTESGKIVEEFLNRLLLEIDRFDKVFKTERGSIYFVLFSGETLRFKMSGGTNMFGLPDISNMVPGVFRLSSITERVFFIGQDDLDEFQDMISSNILNSWEGKRIRNTDISIGSYPVELNRLEGENGEKISFVDHGDSFEFLGGTSGNEGLNIGNIHIGNRVSEIMSSN